MKALYAHSFRLEFTPDGNVYSRFPYPKRWDRYLKHFDEIHVVCRRVSVDIPSKGMCLALGPGVSFSGTPDDHGSIILQLKQQKALEVIKEKIKDCDAVIVRQSKLGWLAAQEACKRNIPWAVEVVGDAWQAYWSYGNLPGRLYAPFAWWKSKQMISKAPYAIYVTNKYLQNRYPCFGTIGSASNVEIFEVSEKVLENRLSGNNCSDKNIKCGMIGDLFNRYKGLHIALRALRICKSKGFDVHLHVLGDGNLNIWIDEAVSLGVDDLLHLEGTLSSGNAVFNWLDSLDFYIQPSFGEGLPRALIEAMSRGLPALGSSCAGIPELLSTECLHQPGDYRNLAKGMLRIIEEPDWKIAQSQRNFKEAKNYYFDKIVEQRNSFWKSFYNYVYEKKNFEYL